MKPPLHVLAAWLLAACTAPALGQLPWDGPTEPFEQVETFEDGVDPVAFWTSYGKRCTVNFKGLSAERAHTGKRSFKLDVTFDDTSRFLWHILLDRKVPAAGELAFSGHLFVDAATTAEVTLGVSFALPPTAHSGCTAWGRNYRTTAGEWRELTDELVSRGSEKSRLIVTGMNWGVDGDNVGALVERFTIDVHAKAGDRLVVYVDDLALRGRVPTDADYAREIERRWRPAQQRFEREIAAFTAGLARTAGALAALGQLSPRAEAMRRELAEQVAAYEKRVADVKSTGELRTNNRDAIAAFVQRTEGAAATIPAVSAAEKAGRKTLLYAVPPISPTMIRPGDRFVPGTPSTALRVVAARGEYEPASFVVATLADLHGLQVRAGDLRTDDGATIPAACVDVKAVKCWYQAGTAWVGIRQDKSRRILTPELLLNDDTLIRVDDAKQENAIKLRFPDGDRYAPISDPADVQGGIYLPVDSFPVKDSPVLLPLDIPAATNKQFWVTVHVPADARAGTYNGDLALQTPTGSLGTLTLTVEVLPFDLLAPYYTSSMDYHGQPVADDKATISSRAKSREQFHNELANMVAHGLRNCQHYSIRKEILGEVLKIRAAVGMDNRTLYLKHTIPIGNPTDPQALETIKRDVRDIIEFTRPYGTEVVYFYGIDEQSGDELASQRPAWTAVREAGGRIFVAGWGDNIERMGDIQDMHVRAGMPDRTEVARWHAYGHRIFSYCNPQTGVENPVVYRRNYGLLLWKFDYDGAATNAYQQTFGATWNDFDHVTFRAHTIAYPTVNGVVDTLAWEGYREGVDDVRYITTLEAAVKAARQSAGPARAAAVRAAERFLQRLKDDQDSVETRDLDDIRREIVTHILELTGVHADAGAAKPGAKTGDD